MDAMTFVLLCTVFIYAMVVQQTSVFWTRVGDGFLAPSAQDSLNIDQFQVMHHIQVHLEIPFM